MFPSSQYIMLHLFYTEVTALCDAIESMDYVAFVLYRSDCPVWCHRVNGLCCICSIQKWLPCVMPSSQWIMLHLFYTEVTALCDAIESMDYVAFCLYRSVCPVCFHRVNGLCCICFIQKCMSCVFPSSQWIMLHLFYIEVTVLCDAIESLDYVRLILYRSVCPVCFHRVNRLCCICFIQKWLSCMFPTSQ